MTTGPNARTGGGSAGGRFGARPRTNGRLGDRRPARKTIRRVRAGCSSRFPSPTKSASRWASSWSRLPVPRSTSGRLGQPRWVRVDGLHLTLRFLGRHAGSSSAGTCHGPPGGGGRRLPVRNLAGRRRRLSQRLPASRALDRHQGRSLATGGLDRPALRGAAAPRLAAGRSPVRSSSDAGSDGRRARGRGPRPSAHRPGRRPAAQLAGGSPCAVPKCPGSRTRSLRGGCRGGAEVGDACRGCEA